MSKVYFKNVSEFYLEKTVINNEFLRNFEDEKAMKNWILTRPGVSDDVLKTILAQAYFWELLFSERFNIQSIVFEKKPKKQMCIDEFNDNVCLKDLI